MVWEKTVTRTGTCFAYLLFVIASPFFFKSASCYLYSFFPITIPVLLLLFCFFPSFSASSLNLLWITSDSRVLSVDIHILFSYLSSTPISHSSLSHSSFATWIFLLFLLYPLLTLNWFSSVSYYLYFLGCDRGSISTRFVTRRFSLVSFVPQIGYVPVFYVSECLSHLLSSTACS